MTKSFRDFVEEDMLFEMASIGTDGKMFFSVDTPFVENQFLIRQIINQ